jgi:hypothetical protein
VLFAATDEAPDPSAVPDAAVLAAPLPMAVDLIELATAGPPLLSPPPMAVL